jgi:hypothetical protein
MGRKKMELAGSAPLVQIRMDDGQSLDAAVRLKKIDDTPCAQVREEAARHGYKRGLEVERLGQ